MPTPRIRAWAASLIRGLRSLTATRPPRSTAAHSTAGHTHAGHTPAADDDTIPGGTASRLSSPPAAYRKPGRLVAFSDGVFAITVTLLVLEIRPPADTRDLLHGLAALWPSYLAYALTFLFIGQVWVNHHVMFDHIRAADRVILLVNTLLLMIVAFLPFATSVLASSLRSGHGQRTAVVFYGLAFGATALAFNIIWLYARHHGLLGGTLGPAAATAISRRFLLALGWLAAGTLLGVLAPALGVAMIAAFNVFYWFPIRGESPAAES